MRLRTQEAMTAHRRKVRGKRLRRSSPEPTTDHTRYWVFCRYGASNLYKPNGAKECARRVRQGLCAP